MTNALPPAVAAQAFVIAGPTGVGKSEIAVALAEACEGEIVGADAFQIYAGLPILTAQPEARLLGRVPHHLVGALPVEEACSVARYVDLATADLHAIRLRGKLPILAGGTGLYLRALLRGMAELPPADQTLRAKLETETNARLLERLAELDPVTAARIDPHNPRRLVRALEVCLLTGRPFSSFREEWDGPNDLPPVGVVLLREREALRERIAQRTEAMFRDGVVAEVQSLTDVGPTAAQTLGLREIQALLAGEFSEMASRAEIQQKTQQYAKRQRTWFRREPQLVELPIDGLSTAGIVARIRHRFPFL